MAVSGGPVLTTERLELWHPAKEDLAELYAMNTHPETRRYFGEAEPLHAQFQRLARNAGSWFLYGYGAFTVRLKGAREIVGNCGIFHSFRGLGEDFDDKPEFGWIIRHDLTGQGLATESAQAALAWFEREHGRREIVCMIAPENEPSLRLAGRFGFRPLRDTVLPDGAAITLFSRPPSRA